MARLPDPPSAINEQSLQSFLAALVRETERRLNALETPAHEGYNPSNVTETRAFDADATSVAELGDVVGTLVNDLKEAGRLG